MFSATLSSEIRPVCKKFMRDVRTHTCAATVLLGEKLGTAAGAAAGTARTAQPGPGIKEAPASPPCPARPGPTAAAPAPYPTPPAGLPLRRLRQPAAACHLVAFFPLSCATAPGAHPPASLPAGWRSRWGGAPRLGSEWQLASRLR